MGVLGGKFPDVTPAQLTAVVGWAVAQVVAFAGLDNEFSQLAVSSSATLVAVIWKLADAFIRSARNKARAVEIAAEYQRGVSVQAKA